MGSADIAKMRIFLGPAPTVWRGSFLLLPKEVPNALQMDQSTWDSFRTPAQDTLKWLNRDVNMRVARCRRTCGVAGGMVIFALVALLVTSYTADADDAEDNVVWVAILPIFFVGAVSYTHYLAAKAIASCTERRLAALGEVCSKATQETQGRTFSVGKDRAPFVAVTWSGMPTNMPDLMPTKMGKSRHTDADTADSGAHYQDYQGGSDDFGGFDGGFIQPFGGGGGGDFSGGGGGDCGGDFGGGGDCGGGGGGDCGGGGGGCD